MNFHTCVTVCVRTCFGKCRKSQNMNCHQNIHGLYRKVNTAAIKDELVEASVVTVKYILQYDGLTSVRALGYVRYTK